MAKLAESTKRKISQAQMGKNNSMFGKHHDESTRKKLSQINDGKNNPMFGKRHSAETKRKISLAAKRRRLKIS
jgi:group I intron endonuclease